MDDILAALAESGKSTAQALAERLGLTPGEMVRGLLLLEQKGRAANLNGYWYVRDVPVVRPVPGARKDG